MNIAVMGTGHVGLVSCVALARMGHEVVGFDVDLEKVSLLQRGVTPFHEPAWTRRYEASSIRVV